MKQFIIEMPDGIFALAITCVGLEKQDDGTSKVRVYSPFVNADEGKIHLYEDGTICFKGRLEADYKEMISKMPPTNFDYITASPERLAEWWYDEKEDICQGSAQSVPCSGKCEQCLLEWLKQETKENTNDKP